MQWLRTLCTIIGAASLVGCADLLPKSEISTESPWKSFEQALAAYNTITPYLTTTGDLKALGLDPFTHENIAILNYADLLRRFALPGNDSAADLDPGLRDCLAATQNCQAWEIEQRDIHRDRTGRFLLDFLNFHRKVTTTGWRFTATIVIRGDVVVYKLWNGQPAMLEVEETRNPLGPLQSTGEANPIRLR